MFGEYGAVVASPAARPCASCFPPGHETVAAWVPAEDNLPPSAQVQVQVLAACQSTLQCPAPTACAKPPDAETELCVELEQVLALPWLY